MFVDYKKLRKKKEVKKERKKRKKERRERSTCLCIPEKNPKTEVLDTTPLGKKRGGETPNKQNLWELYIETFFFFRQTRRTYNMKIQTGNNISGRMPTEKQHSLKN